MGTVLVERLERTRRRTLDLYAPLPEEHLVAQPSPLLSPRHEDARGWFAVSLARRMA